MTPTCIPPVRTEQALDGLTGPELDALIALDFACWENGESGGDGWVRVGAVAALENRSFSWAYRRLIQLKTKGLAERVARVQHAEGLGYVRYFDYAPTELGAEVVVLADED